MSDGSSVRSEVKGEMPIRKTIDERQKKLAENLAKGMPDIQAYIEAGYSEKAAKGNASRCIEALRKNSVWKKYYDGLMEPDRKKRRKSVDDILDFWESVMDDQNASMKDRLRASENRAKAQGMFVDKKEVDLTGGLPVVIKEDVAEDG